MSVKDASKFAVCERWSAPYVKKYAGDSDELEELSELDELDLLLLELDLLLLELEGVTELEELEAGISELEELEAGISELEELLLSAYPETVIVTSPF